MKIFRFKTTIPISALDPDRDEFPVTVEYEYEPASGDGWNEPRYPESVEICGIHRAEDAEGEDIFEWFDANEIDWIEEQIMLEIKNKAILEAERRFAAREDAREWRKGP